MTPFLSCPLRSRAAITHAHISIRTPSPPYRFSASTNPQQLPFRACFSAEITHASLEQIRFMKVQRSRRREAGELWRDSKFLEARSNQEQTSDTLTLPQHSHNTLSSRVINMTSSTTVLPKQLSPRSSTSCRAPTLARAPAPQLHHLPPAGTERVQCESAQRLLRTKRTPTQTDRKWVRKRTIN